MVGTKFNLIPRLCRCGVCAAALACAAVLFIPSPAIAQDGALRTDQPGPSGPRQPDTQRHLGVPKPSSASTSTLQSPAEPAPPASGAVRTATSLAAVLGLVLLAAFTLKRLARSHGGLLGAAGPGGRAPAGVLEVLGRYPLSRGLSLILLKLDRRILLLSQSASGRLGGGGGASLTTLCEIDDPEEIASILVKVREEEGESLARRFHSVLGRADKATADAQGEDPTSPTSRRTTIHPSGDRVELWSDTQDGPIQSTPTAYTSQARGFAPSMTDQGRAIHTPASETGADALRRRLGSLRRLGGDDELGGGDRP